MIGAAAYWAKQRGCSTVLGGMIPVDHHWLNLMERLRRARSYIDVVGIHAFPGMWLPGEPNWDWHDHWHGWDAKIAYIAEHAGGRPVWVTETGLATWDLALNRESQVRVAVSGACEAAAAPAERVYWYSLIDLDPARDAIEGFHVDENEYHMGLVKHDGYPQARLLPPQRTARRPALARIIHAVPSRQRSPCGITVFVPNTLRQHKETRMVAQSDLPIEFDFVPQSDVVVQQHRGRCPADAGLLPLRQFDERCGYTRRMADCLAGLDDPMARREHSLLSMLRQRFYGVLAGYEDCNDHDTLRDDPVFKLVAGRLPGDDPLASQPTLSRFENLVTPAVLQKLIDFNIAAGIERLKHKHGGKLPAVITLDLDATDDPTHGHQQTDAVPRLLRPVPVLPPGHQRAHHQARLRRLAAARHRPRGLGCGGRPDARGQRPAQGAARHRHPRPRRRRLRRAVDVRGVRGQRPLLHLRLQLQPAAQEADRGPDGQGGRAVRADEARRRGCSSASATVPRLALRPRRRRQRRVPRRRHQPPLRRHQPACSLPARAARPRPRRPRRRALRESGPLPRARRYTTTTSAAARASTGWTS